MKVKEEYSNAFKSNYHGILCHNGEIKVAKGDAENTIKSIITESGKITGVYCKGVGKKYLCQIHKDLQTSMIYCEPEDTGFVKFKKGTAWLVGFRKSKEKYIDERLNKEIVLNGDCTLLEYFQEQSRLSDVYDSRIGGGING